MSDHPVLVHVHDPMCSWCWGFRPAFERLLTLLPPSIQLRQLLGGLAPDSDEPMPEAMRRYLQDTWRRIQQRIPGTEFNFDFWKRCQPRRSTWPACRAVIAARNLDPAAEAPMIQAIQNAYYREARNPSDDDTLIALASEIGLPRERFVTQLNATATQQALEAEIAEARQLGADSFPTLILQLPDGGRWRIPVDYTAPGAMHALIVELVADRY
ncbi:DsbA family protein [endosymbiont of unidentified scaly snail isolate Monju]|uniref:DsbA family protein n=1 Tax=endosymbiont of unidentified scaly snail isolate Monju TaxID=1248727 RepID=UPI0003892878|nr:DsbA family protein [endosymbiont of unidentified scaly snail isolate Monju]BAN69992.1 putative protein-disulfide isomerase [endosymbiont of unidentified scaly snail isolate Monju]